MEFVTLEDEYGVFEVTLFPDVYRRFAAVARTLGPYVIEGRVEECYGAITVSAATIELGPGVTVESGQDGSVMLEGPNGYVGTVVVARQDAHAPDADSVVADAKTTDRDEIALVREQFEQVGGHVLGAVLSNATSSR
jgi:DNA polymerase III alpha subunit